MVLPLTLDRLSLWELAHRLCNKGFDYYWFKPIPADVKDTIRSLMNEILAERLDSSLFYEKKNDVENDLFGGAEFLDKNILDIFLDKYVLRAFLIRTHIDKINNCVANHSYPKNLLKFIQIEQLEFAHWCDMAGYPLPEFWFGLNQDWTYSDNHYFEKVYGQWTLEELENDPQFKTFSKSEQLKMKARSVAVSLWHEDRTRPALDIANSPEMQEIVGHYSERIIRKWIQPVSPKELRNKKGRPKNKINEKKEDVN